MTDEEAYIEAFSATTNWITTKTYTVAKVCTWFAVLGAGSIPHDLPVVIRPHNPHSVRGFMDAVRREYS